MKEEKKGLSGKKEDKKRQSGKKKRGGRKKWEEELKPQDSKWVMRMAIIAGPFCVTRNWRRRERQETYGLRLITLRMSTMMDWSSKWMACSRPFMGSFEDQRARTICTFFFRWERAVTRDLCPLMILVMASVSDISGWGWYPIRTVSWRCLGRKSSMSNPAGWSRFSGINSTLSSDDHNRCRRETVSFLVQDKWWQLLLLV